MHLLRSLDNPLGDFLDGVFWRNSLDPTATRGMSDLAPMIPMLASINEEFGTTVLVITHNVAVGGMADRVIHFADGRVARIEQNEIHEAAASIAW